MKTYALLVLLIVCQFYFSCSSDDDTTPTTNIAEEEDMVADNVAKTTIPDPVFEQFLVNNNLDDVVDGEVVTENLLIVTNLILDDLNITDLTGIEDFPNLDNLWLQNTNLTSLDISQNTLLKFLYFDNNNVTTIDVSNLSVLEKLSFINNDIQEINVGSNLNLQILDIKGNPISALDVSTNVELFTLETTDTNLNCIQVNEDQLGDIPVNWVKDDTTSYELDCT